MSGRSVATVFIILLIGFGMWRGRQDREAGSSADPAAPAGNEKYVAAGDEGLGAAIAIMIDNSGSMLDRAGSDLRPKYVVAREALNEMLASTDSFVARQSGFPVKIGLYFFSDAVETLAPMRPYDRAALTTALENMPRPQGGTAIGEAMDVARTALYQSGIIRKHILVVTDGENTKGREPREVGLEIARLSEGAVRMYFVAFDIDAGKFGFVREVRGEVLGASNAAALRASLDTIYRGKILAEAVDAGETLTKQP